MEVLPFNLWRRQGRQIWEEINRAYHKLHTRENFKRLPTLIECNGIPQDKEIPTPEIAREHPHLISIAVEIPPLDKETKIQLLIGRDVPELLKVRAFKNGPKGAPWAQKLALGWTISGQTCLDLKDGPIHVQAKRTSVVTDSEVGVASTGDLIPFNLTTHVARTGVNKGAEYEIVICSNTMNFFESFTKSSDAKEYSRCLPRN